MKITKRDLREIIAEQLKEAAQVIDDIPREGDDADMGYDPIADMLGVPQGDAEDYAAAERLRKGSTKLPSGQKAMSPEEIEAALRAQAEDLGIDPEVYMARFKLPPVEQSPPIKESNMKLTKQKLKDLIIEEMSSMKVPSNKSRRIAKQKLYRIIKEEMQAVMEQSTEDDRRRMFQQMDQMTQQMDQERQQQRQQRRKQRRQIPVDSPQDMFDKMDDKDFESGESEEGGVITRSTQTTFRDDGRIILMKLSALNLPPGREANLKDLLGALKIAMNSEKINANQKDTIYNLAAAGKDRDAMAMVKKLFKMKMNENDILPPIAKKKKPPIAKKKKPPLAKTSKKERLQKMIDNTKAKLAKTNDASEKADLKRRIKAAETNLRNLENQ